MGMRPTEIRALLFARKLKSTSVPDDMIDSWESGDSPEELQALVPLKGQLLLLEAKGSDTTKANKVAKDPDGTVDEAKISAYVICQSLVTADTKERILSDTDFEAVSEWGMSVLNPLQELIQSISNMGDKAVIDAKKNSQSTPGNTSSTSSAVNSVPVVPEATTSGQSA